LAEAVRTLQPGFNPSNYNFVGGTGGDDIDTFTATAGPDVFCGFGGDDRIALGFAWDEGDIFLGGEGNDSVFGNAGTFFGGEGFVSVLFGTAPVDGP
jgi:Ca2+-binding RTX toxin-like protein